MDNLSLVFFRVIIAYIRGRLDTFVNIAYAPGGLLAYAFGAGAVIMVLWVMLRGYGFLSGTAREPFGAFVTHTGKMMLVLAALSSGVFFNTDIRTGLTDLRDEIAQVVTGSSENVYHRVDNMLSDMNLAITLLDNIDTSSDPAVTESKQRAITLALVGQATPPIMGGLLSLLNEIAVSIGIIFGPIFILGLMFEQTAPMFFAWLKYMVTAMFSMAILSVMVQLCLEVSLYYIIALGAATVLGAGGTGTIPQLQSSLIQAGLGMILTTLMLTVPGMVGNFFGTSLSAIDYNRFAQLSPSPTGKSQEREQGGGGGGGRREPSYGEQAASTQAANNRQANVPTTNAPSTVRGQTPGGPP
jgi:type IV secretion system protein VirB6